MAIPPRARPSHRPAAAAEPNRPYIVRDQRQVRALASVTRQAVVDIVAAAGPCSIRVVAARLGRPPGALYHHVRALRDVGLLLAVAPLPGRGRPGVLLDVPGRPLVIRYEPRQPATKPALRKVVASMTRAASRDFVRAYRPGVSVSGDARSLWAARTEAWLTDAGLRAVNRLLHRLHRQMHPVSRRHLAASHPHSLTFVLAPAAAAEAAPRASGTGRPRRGRIANRTRDA